MADPLLGAQQLTGEYDPDARTFEARAWVAGPAGTATLSLGGGVELDVDVADPSVCVALRFDAPLTGDPTALHRRTAAVLDALLGSTRAAALVGLVHAGGKPVVLPGGIERRLDIGTDREGGVDARLQRRALARSLAAHATSPLERGVALLEAASAGRLLTGIPGSRSRSRSDARAGAELLAGGIGRLELPSPVAASLAALLADASALLDAEPSLADRLLVIAADLRTERYRVVRSRDMDDGRQVAAAMAMPMAMERGSARGVRRALVREPRPRPTVPVERWSLPDALRDEPIEAVLSDPSDVVVTLRGWAGRTDGWWARVARDADGVLLAAAQFQPQGVDSAAVLLVPERHGVVVDVTADPSSRRPSPARRSTDAALALGRRAAQSERRHDLESARLWQQCGDAWEHARDAMREGLARSYTGGSGRRGRRLIPEPLVADLIAVNDG